MSTSASNGTAGREVPHFTLFQTNQIHKLHSGSKSRLRLKPHQRPSNTAARLVHNAHCSPLVSPLAARAVKSDCLVPVMHASLAVIRGLVNAS
eukprot:2207515-Rhodomonas_salina.1